MKLHIKFEIIMTSHNEKSIENEVWTEILANRNKDYSHSPAPPSIRFVLLADVKDITSILKHPHRS